MPRNRASIRLNRPNKSKPAAIGARNGPFKTSSAFSKVARFARRPVRCGAVEQPCNHAKDDAAGGIAQAPGPFNPRLVADAFAQVTHEMTIVSFPELRAGAHSEAQGDQRQYPASSGKVKHRPRLVFRAGRRGSSRQDDAKRLVGQIDVDPADAGRDDAETGRLPAVGRVFGSECCVAQSPQAISREARRNPDQYRFAAALADIFESACKIF